MNADAVRRKTIIISPSIPALVDGTKFSFAASISEGSWSTTQIGKELGGNRFTEGMSLIEIITCYHTTPFCVSTSDTNHNTIYFGEEKFKCRTLSYLLAKTASLPSPTIIHFDDGSYSQGETEVNEKTVTQPPSSH
jgi:hypothetical protein